MGDAGGEERKEGKEGAGVGRGMKNVKIWKGEKKEKNCACRSEKGGGRQGAGVRPTLLSILSYLKTKATIRLVFKINPPPTNTFWFEAGCNHFEKCVNPPTVIIIEKRKLLENILCGERSKVRQVFYFFLLT